MSDEQFVPADAADDYVPDGYDMEAVRAASESAPAPADAHEHDDMTDLRVEEATSDAQ